MSTRSDWTRILLLLLLALLLARPGCSQMEGSGRIWGELDWPACEEMDGPFDMALDFFAIEPFGKREAMVRLQQGGRGPEVSEGMVLSIYDLEEVDRKRGEKLPVMALDLERSALGEYLSCSLDAQSWPSHCPLVRAELNLPRRCPRSATSPALVGEAVFTYLGLGINERVAGGFDLEAVDRRDGARLGELHGHFDFVVRRGHPYQRFAH